MPQVTELLLPQLELSPDQRRWQQVEALIFCLGLPLLLAVASGGMLMRSGTLASQWFVVPVVLIPSNLAFATISGLWRASHWERQRSTLPQGLESLKVSAEEFEI